jgi:hypothetical protein
VDRPLIAETEPSRLSHGSGLGRAELTAHRRALAAGSRGPGPPASEGEIIPGNSGQLLLLAVKVTLLPCAAAGAEYLLTPTVH